MVGIVPVSPTTEPLMPSKPISKHLVHYMMMNTFVQLAHLVGNHREEHLVTEMLHDWVANDENIKAIGVHPLGTFKLMRELLDGATDPAVIRFRIYLDGLLAKEDDIAKELGLSEEEKINGISSNDPRIKTTLGEPYIDNEPLMDPKEMFERLASILGVKAIVVDVDKGLPTRPNTTLN
jgi:hypothetical protein